MNSFGMILRTELRLTLRDFFTVFFALVFPSLMLLIFGSIFGGYPGQTGATMLDDMTPAYCCMVIGVTGLMGFPLTVASNIERGAYRRFDASPAGKLRIVGGELAANLLLTFAGLAILLVFARLGFGVVPRGNAWAVTGAMALATASLFALGFFLVAAAPGTRVALTLCYAVYFVMLFLSGATLPEMLFSSGVRTVSDFLPMTYAVRLLQAAFNGTSAGVAGDIAVLGAVGLGCGLAGSILFRRRF